MSDKKETAPKPWKATRSTIKHRWLVPFIAIEHGCEWLAYWFSRWAFLAVLEYLGKLSLVAALIVFVAEVPKRKLAREEQRRGADDQRKAKHYQAWMVINTSRGAPGDGGRNLAMTELAADGVALSGIDLSNARLLFLSLSNASMNNAILSGAVLLEASLIGCHFDNAQMTNVNMYDAFLYGSSFSRADLRAANLADCNLASAHFHEANLQNANLALAVITDTSFFGADLRGANLGALQDWTNAASFGLANIYGVRNAPKGFVEWAKREHMAVEMESEQEWKRMKDERHRKARERLDR